jgi:hypothetical protein
MKKILIMCFTLIPMLFASYNADGDMVQKSNIFSESGIRALVIPEGALDIETLSRQEDSLYYYTSSPTANGVGLTSPGVWEGGIRLTPTELGPYAGWQIIAIIWYHYDGSSPNGQVKVYDNNTPTQPGAVITTEPYSGSVTGWDRVDLSSPVPITGAGDLWCTVELNDPGSGFYPLGVDAGPAIDGKGDWIYFGGVWAELQSYGLDYNWGFIVMVEPAAGPTVWDFETGHQGWTHTNGQAFPGAWDVVTTTYPGGPYWTYQPPPDAGDSAFIVDDDAAGSSTSTIDTAMSPVVANPGFSMLKWGYFIVYDTMEVLVREWTGTWGSWNVVAAYRGTTGPAWDSVDVSSYTGDSIQVGFHYNDEGYWSYGATFDNVGLYPPPYHDVGVVSIDAPPATIFPNTTIDPSATYQNFGSTAETFDVYFVIDSSGTTIYNETANITLDPGVDTTITFASWTCGAGDGIIYDITAYNYLSGDVNPSNDTITMQTITSGVGAWTQCANMPTGECANATAYDPVNDRIYSFGGTMAGGVGDYQNFTYRYDPVGNAWTTMANMPNACDWIDASYVNGKFYVIGGYNGTANNWNMIYDISGNVWSTGATLTQPRHSHQQVLYNDSLIYVLGGRDASGTAHSTVFIYNTYTDAWTTGTSMPTTCHKGGAAIIDSTIYLVGGWNNAGTALASIYVGAIDPANCENITWSTGAALPYANAAAGVIQGQRSGNWYIYMVGGFVNGATVTDEAWEYIVASNLWNQLPDYTPFSIARNNYAVHRDGYNELYVCGGGSAGTFTGTNQVWKLPWQVGIAEQPGGETPVGYGFAPMVNPTRNQAVISYNITKPGMVSLKVYDRTGRLVETLVNNTQNAGTQTVTWDARKMSNGVYFLRLEAEGNTATYKLVLVR